MSYSPADKTRLLAEAADRMEAYFVDALTDAQEPLRAADREAELAARARASLTDGEAVALHDHLGNVARAQRRAILAAGGLAAFSRNSSNNDLDAVYSE